MNKKQLRGNCGEDYTADYLTDKGFKILSRNFKRKGGELDIVALDGDELVIVEVKSRKFGSITEGIDAITHSKKRNIIRIAARYIDENDISFSGMRFEVAEIVVTTDELPSVLEFNYYKDAFDADGFDEITAWL